MYHPKSEEQAYLPGVNGLLALSGAPLTKNFILIIILDKERTITSNLPEQ